MLLVVIDDVLGLVNLRIANAPKTVTIKPIKAPLNPQRSANSFGIGSSSLATAMRLAVNTRSWFGNKPYFYEVSDDAKAALTLMKLEGRKLRTFVVVDEIAYRKALIMVDFFLYGTWMDGELETNNIISSMVSQLGFDPDELRAQTMAMMTNFEINGLPDADYIGIRGNFTTRIAAYVMHEALSGRLHEIIG
jgi:hypothetical protein